MKRPECRALVRYGCDGSRDESRSFREGLDAGEIVAREAGDRVERDGSASKAAALKV
jgi:hypothetical protein